MKPHPLLERFLTLKISWAQAARELGIAKSTLYSFLHGKDLTQNHAPAVSAWIAAREKQQRQNVVKTAPMLHSLFALGFGVPEAAKALMLAPSDAYRILNTGEWPNQETVDRFRKWVQEQKERRKKKMITKVILEDEVIEYFGLKTNPFPHELKSVEDIISLKDLELAEKKIMLTINRGGFCGVTGTTGCGKTTLLKKIEDALSARKDIVFCKPRTVEKQYLGASGLCDALLEDLHWPWSKGHRLEMRARYVGQALEHNYRSGKKVILLIDEAHLLTDDALLALKRFYEFEIGFKKLLAIVLVGQEKLSERLHGVKLAEIGQRIDLFEIHALNGQFARYLKEKLRLAGMNGRDIFDASAMKAIYERMREAGGFYTPQSLQNLAGAAMVAAHDLGEKTVTAKIIRGIPEAF